MTRLDELRYQLGNTRSEIDRNLRERDKLEERKNEIMAEMEPLEADFKYDLPSKNISSTGFIAAVDVFEQIWAEGDGDNGENATLRILEAYLGDRK